MAELADAADSKSAGLRPLGVQLPLPAPASKAARDAAPSQVGSFMNEVAGPSPKTPCDRPVTGDGRKFGPS